MLPEPPVLPGVAINATLVELKGYFVKWVNPVVVEDGKTVYDSRVVLRAVEVRDPAYPKCKPPIRIIPFR